MIYLDYNATAPMLPAVRAAMKAVGGLPLNPASIHAAGRHAKKLLEDARRDIAQALSAFPNEVLFVGSGTEANNMVLRAFAPTHTLMVSAVEHASIHKTGGLLGAAVVPVDGAGVVDLTALESQLAVLSARPVLLSIMLANNETGVIQPIAEIARIAHAHGALVHCDAVQALGKIPLDWGLLGVDMLTLCAHKCGGPVGVGALLIRSDLALAPMFTGGGQELGRRAGTENIPAIVGFAALVREVAHCPQAAQWRGWQEWLAAEIQRIAPDTVVFGADAAAKNTSPLRGEVGALATGGGDAISAIDAEIAPITPPSPPSQPSPLKGEGAVSRLPNTLQLTMPGVPSQTQLMNFDLAGFAVSAGSACSSGRVAPSHVLLAMGVPPEVADTAIRISWGWGTTEAEIHALAKAWGTVYRRLSPSA